MTPGLWSTCSLTIGRAMVVARAGDGNVRFGQFLRRLVSVGIPFASLYRRCGVDAERTAEGVEYDLDLFDVAERGNEPNVDEWRHDV